MLPLIRNRSTESFFYPKTRENIVIVNYNASAILTGKLPKEGMTLDALFVIGER